MEFFFVKLKSIFFPKEEEESRRKKKCISSYIECIFLLHLSIRIFRSIYSNMDDGSNPNFLKKIEIVWKPGLYMIGYRIWKNILKFLPFCQSRVGKFFTSSEIYLFLFEFEFPTLEVTYSIFKKAAISK